MENTSLPAFGIRFNMANAISTLLHSTRVIRYPLIIYIYIYDKIYIDIGEFSMYFECSTFFFFVIRQLIDVP